MTFLDAIAARATFGRMACGVKPPMTNAVIQSRWLTVC
jgi:hypothetical protein